MMVLCFGFPRSYSKLRIDMAGKHYIVGGKDGWLKIKPEPSGADIALPEYLQVELTASKAGRDYFTVLEGVKRGKKFSVKVGNLKSGNPGYRAPVALQYFIARQLLTYPGGQVKAITDIEKPIAVGTHPLQIPDFPHNGGIGYLVYSPYAKNWFFLGQGNALPGRNDRYLHTGLRTEGCITVEPSRWTQLYRYLILCRRNDGKTVGTVSVFR